MTFHGGYIKWSVLKSSKLKLEALRAFCQNTICKEGPQSWGLAGCGIWLFLVVILGMRAENRSGMREF